MIALYYCMIYIERAATVTTGDLVELLTFSPLLPLCSQPYLLMMQIAKFHKQQKQQTKNKQQP